MSLQKDYTGGQLPELIDIIIKSKASLFVCAVGVPPKWAVDKLHAAGIPLMKYVLLNFPFSLSLAIFSVWLVEYILQHQIFS